MVAHTLLLGLILAREMSVRSGGGKSKVVVRASVRGNADVTYFHVSRWHQQIYKKVKHFSSCGVG
jgi:hypothetical protein